MNAYYAAALRGLGEALGDLGHPDAASFKRHAAELRANTLRAYAWTQSHAPALPLRDGTFAWQVVALDRLRLAAPDPSLSDASGNLRVFRGVASPAARFVRAGGRNQPVEVQAARTLDFAAELETPDVAGTVPLPHPLLTLRVGTAGTDVSWRVRFGACDTTPQGTSTYPGRFAVDVRLRSPAEALLFLSPTAGGLVTHVASCRAERTAGAVRVVCGEPSPVGGA